MNPSPDITWKIGTELTELTGGQFEARYFHAHMPEKFKALGGGAGI